MEIYHGFLRKPYAPVHAFMYQRDPSFISEIRNPDHRRIFDFDYESQPEIQERRDKLMCEQGPCAVDRRRGQLCAPPPPCLTWTAPSPPPCAARTPPILTPNRVPCCFCSSDIANHQFCLCREYSCTYGGLDEEGKHHVTNLQVGACAFPASPSPPPLCDPVNPQKKAVGCLHGGPK
jgi:hypothetical protein